jgi:putative transposase
MPRTARASVGGVIYHATHRGNRSEAVFHEPADYDAFVESIAEACRRLPLDLFGYCLMPNHFHVVVRTQGDGDLGRWMRWLLTAHAQRYHRQYQTSGHVWQGRDKAFAVQADDHVSTLLHYVEQNPLCVELVARAEHWKWSSLPGWLARDPQLWRGKLLPRDRAWLNRVNQPLLNVDLQKIQESVVR